MQAEPVRRWTFSSACTSSCAVSVALCSRSNAVFDGCRGGGVGFGERRVDAALNTGRFSFDVTSCLVDCRLETARGVLRLLLQLAQFVHLHLAVDVPLDLDWHSYALDRAGV